MKSLGIFALFFTVLLTAACRIQNPHKAGENSGTDSGVSIFVTNDVHYLAPSLHDQGRRIILQRDGKNIQAQPALLGALKMSIEAKKPGVLLVNGDLTFNGERESHRELARYFAALEELGTRVLVLPGNHDIANPYARNFSGKTERGIPSVSPKKFAAIYRDFGFKEALSRDRTSLSYIAEPVPGLRIFMLDSCKYGNNRRLGYPETGGAIKETTRAWIRKQAAKAREDKVLLLAALHHNIMDHHPMITKDFTIDEPESFQDLLLEEGINFITSGHIHAQEISMRERGAGPVYDIATSALAVYPHQIGTLTLMPAVSVLSAPESSGAVWYYAVKPLDVAAWARNSGNGDERFLSFGRWSKEFFIRSSEGMVRRQAGNPLKPEDLKALCSLMGTLNIRYFSGTSHLNAQDLKESLGYKVLQEHAADFGFLAGYAETIMNGGPPGDTKLALPPPKG
jgi:3',5'-cyclic AMP phosphodiesterase CpdA